MRRCSCRPPMHSSVVPWRPRQRVFRHGKGEDAYMTIETDQTVTQDMVAMIEKLCHNIIKMFAV